jgi:hypothetical protein
MRGQVTMFNELNQAPSCWHWHKGGKMPNFLETRNLMMGQLGWNRRVATLAARLLLGVDTWDIIAACSDFHDYPLLTVGEATMIRNTLCIGHND